MKWFLINDNSFNSKHLLLSYFEAVLHFLCFLFADWFVATYLHLFMLENQLSAFSNSYKIQSFRDEDDWECRFSWEKLQLKAKHRDIISQFFIKASAFTFCINIIILLIDVAITCFLVFSNLILQLIDFESQIFIFTFKFYIFVMKIVKVTVLSTNQQKVCNQNISCAITLLQTLILRNLIWSRASNVLLRLLPLSFCSPDGPNASSISSSSCSKAYISSISALILTEECGMILN